MITAHSRGHKTIIKNIEEISPGIWSEEEYYIDTGKIVDNTRSCKKCGKKPTKEGHDACIGFIPEASSACCGHGLEKGYIMIRGFRILINEERKTKDKTLEFLS